MASSQTIAEAVENSLNAYNIISKKHLESVNYDTTVKAKIVDIKNRDLGEYKVNDGTSIFYAYSEKTDYYNGQTVWVTIPNGDYSQQKFIQGKYVENENSEPFTYVSPLDSFVDMTQNLIEPGMVNETGLIANGDIEEIILWSIFGRELIGYDRLAIQAGFKSWLKSLNIQSGDYGLRLDIVSNMTGTSQTSNNRKLYQVLLNTNDFYGDVYNFETFYNQIKVVDISMIECIESMSLVFYQGKNFQDLTNNLILPGTFSNIWVQEPYVSLGFDASRFTQDTVLLTTNDSKTYAPYLSERAKADFIASLNPSTYPVGSQQYIDIVDKVESGDSDTIRMILNRLNRKNMTAHYIHINEDGKPDIYGPGDILPDGIILHWYQSVLHKDVNDKLAGPFWEEKIPEADNLFKINNFYPNISLPNEKFKVIVENPSREEKAIEVYNNNLFEKTYEENGIQQKIIDYKSRPDIDETYYDWAIGGLDAIEKTKQQAVASLSDKTQIREAEQAIYDEYLQVLAAEGLSPEQAAADDINIEYRKKLMNVRTNLNSHVNEYTNLYNEIIGTLEGAISYQSEILEFTNEEEVPNTVSLQLVDGLTLTVDDDYHGHYHIYNEQGEIISKRESQKKRVITANWKQLITGDRKLDNIDSIEWLIPTTNTMIQYPEKGVEYTDYELVTFEDQIAFVSYPYNLYRKVIGSEEYRLYTDRDPSAYSQTYYKRTATSYTPDTYGNNYFSIQRSGQKFEEQELGKEEPASSGQVFRIKEFYNENLVNNTIKCIIHKDNLTYEAELTLTFGPTGTAGTDYTFQLEFAEKIPALTVGTSNLVVIPHLYNYENKDVIEEHLNTLEYGWYSPFVESASNYKIQINDSNKMRVILTISNQNNIEALRYYILGAKVRVSTLNNKNIDLYTYKPVPVRQNDSYISIDGADKVYYNSGGTNPSYYKDPYKIYTYDFENQKTIEIKNVSWAISLGEEIGSQEPDPNFYPILSDNYALIPPSIYIKENGREIAVECSQNGNIIWTQPLYIYQNEYSSALLNSWDGSLTLDEENGIILSRTVGAGSKDDRNRYQGVLMGDITQVDNTPIYGLYGYDGGVQSFGFKIDGTAFIGKAGKGQINFNGNSGQISSLSRNVSAEKGEGMLIDLDDGYIDIKGSNVLNVKEIETGALYDVLQVLNLEKKKYTDLIAEYEREKSKRHTWNDMVSIQKDIDNRIDEYEDFLEDINKTLEVFNQEDKYIGETDKIKYLQDNNLTYLINNDDYIPVYEGNRSGVRISTTNPYFTITSDNSKELIHIADDEYFLQTDDYQSESDELIVEEDEEGNTTEHSTLGRGLKINLKGKRKEGDPDGYIEGYNFKLKGVNSDKTDNLVGSFFELNSSGEPFLQVHYVNNDNNSNFVKDLKLRGYLEVEEKLVRDLIKISKDTFILQSPNYYPHTFDTSQISGYRKHTINPSQSGEGFLLDLQNGKLEGHNFDISAVNSKYIVNGNNITYDSEAGSYIMLSSSGDPYFRIHYQYIENPNSGYTDSQVWKSVDEQGVYINKNVDLINISHSDFSIMSRDYQAPTGKAIGRGIYFDLSGNKVLGTDISNKSIKGSTIEAYSFILDAYRPGLINRDIRSRIRINSSATGMRNESPVYAIVPNQDFLLRNNNSLSEYEIQHQIDVYRQQYPNESLTDTANRFTSINNISPVKIVTGVEYDDPFIIGGLFSVSWSGKVNADYLVAKQGGRIGPFVLCSNALYSNNGILSNGQPFYNSSGSINEEPQPYGVYLGSDGMSIRDKFVMYKMPINKIKSDKTNLNNNDTHKLRIPLGYNVNTKKQEFTDVKDFVTTGYYTNKEIGEYFLNCSGTYDQVFKTVNDNIFALGNLSFYLNGNSVLNGVTAMNGNTYIFGHLQVGEYLSILGEETANTNNSVVLYANTSVWGIFRTTGKTYIGDQDTKWANNEDVLRDDSRQIIDNDRLGAIIYRNTYITGFLKVAGGMVVGDATPTNAIEYDSKKLTSDFTAYVKNAKFFGDLEVAAGFVAGSLSTDEPIGENLARVPKYTPNINNNSISLNLSYVNGSGIQSKYIFLGRSPQKINNSSNQSDLIIYANTTQYGNFIAGINGQSVELYANKNGAGSYGYIKLNKNGISILTGENQPFELKTNGGDITIDGTNSSYGGNIYLKAGTGKNRKLYITGGDNDYIKFNEGAMSISARGSIELKAGEASFSLSNNIMTLSNNVGELKFEDSALTLSGGNGELKFNSSGFSLKGGNASLTGNSDNNFTLSGDTTINGNIYANNLKLGDNGVIMNGNSFTPSASDNGLQFASNGGNPSFWLGKWTVVGGCLQSDSNNPEIKLDPSTATIYFGSDYIDGRGAGRTNDKGLRLYGGASIYYNTVYSHVFQINGDTKVSIGSQDMVISENVSIGHGQVPGGGGSNATNYNFSINGQLLGKLAFADDIKKKFKLTLSQMNSSGGTEYFTQIEGKNIYLAKTGTINKFYFITTNFPTLYIKNKSLDTLYKLKARQTPIYSDVEGTIYKKDFSKTIYVENWVYGIRYYKGSDTTRYFNFSYEVDDFGQLYNKSSWISDSPEGMEWEPFNTFIKDDYIDLREEYGYSSTTLAEVGTSADITDIADEVTLVGSGGYFKEKDIMNDNLTEGKVTDVVDQKKITWQINGSTTKEITLEANENGTQNVDTIDIVNSDFNYNSVALSLTSANI